MNDTISLFDLVELATADVDEVSHHQPALQSVTVSGEASEAITFPVGSKLALPVEIPSGTILEFSLALLTRLERGEDVEFRVYVEAGGKRARAFSEVLTPDAVARWSRRRADLTDWGARRVQKHKRVAKPLMVALSIIMIDETRRRPSAPVLSSFVFLDTTRSKRPGAPVLSSFVFLDRTA